jgi:NIMA (never in mitosis gene a)-related kinase
VDDQVYAVKLIPCKTAKELDNIKREAKVLWSMQHRNITRYFSAFRHKEYFCVVMEFCSGGNLNDVVTKARQDKLTPKLTIRQVKLWVSQIAEALSYLKTLNLLHRDLKGDNIFLSDGRCKLADFGLAASAQLIRGQAGA